MTQRLAEPAAATATREDPARSLLDTVEAKLAEGLDTDGYRQWFGRLTAHQRVALKDHHEALKARAAANDKPSAA